jgi:hypothetical protein
MSCQQIDMILYLETADQLSARFDRCLETLDGAWRGHTIRLKCNSSHQRSNRHVNAKYPKQMSRRR